MCVYSILRIPTEKDFFYTDNERFCFRFELNAMFFSYIDVAMAMSMPVRGKYCKKKGLLRNRSEKTGEKMTHADCIDTHKQRSLC